MKVGLKLAGGIHALLKLAGRIYASLELAGHNNARMKLAGSTHAHVEFAATCVCKTAAFWHESCLEGTILMKMMMRTSACVQALTQNCRAGLALMRLNTLWILGC